MLRYCPALMFVLRIPFHFIICFTVTLYFSAMPPSVSPLFTLWRLRVPRPSSFALACLSISATLSFGKNSCALCLYMLSSLARKSVTRLFDKRNTYGSFSPGIISLIYCGLSALISSMSAPQTSAICLKCRFFYTIIVSVAIGVAGSAGHIPCSLWYVIM